MPSWLSGAEALKKRNKEWAEAYLAQTAENTDLGWALISDGEKGDMLGKMLRYETTLTNTLTRTVSMLSTLQNTRRLAAEEHTIRVDP